MPYIGNTPATQFASLTYQDLTGESGTTFTLDSPVGSAQDIEVFVNNVRQEPGVAYNITGSTGLTMTGSIASTDDFYVVFQGKSIGTVSHPSGSALEASTGTFSSGVTATTGTFSSALSATTGTFTGDVSTTGDFKPTGKEYFHVDLTTNQSGLGDDTAHIVDFGGSGTVKYDTKSNFDSANDAYLLDSSDGVYLISYSIGFKSSAVTTETMQDAGAVVRIATDGTTFADVNGSGAHLMTDSNNEVGSITLSGTFIYKSTTATTKVHLYGYANMAGANYNMNHEVENLINSTITFGATARPTFLSIVRIA